VLDPGNDQIVARVPTGASPHIANLFRGAPAATVVVQGPGELTFFSPDSHRVLRSVSVGRQPHWVAAAADAGTLYVTNEGSNDLSVIDVASGTVRSVAVGQAPHKVVVQQQAAVVGAQVSITNLAFTPSAWVIEAVQSVTWTNDDGAPHGLAYADGAPGTSVLLPGEHFTRRFDAPGNFAHTCPVHPYMSAQVTVRPR
jgi:YVTN family beta-propeller protein